MEINVKSTNEIEQSEKAVQIEPVKLPELNIEKSVMRMSPVSYKKRFEADVVDRSM